MSPRWALAPLVFGLMLAGCAGSGDPASLSAPSGGAPQPTPDDSTGSITGTIVDESIQPVAGADVGLTEANVATTSDAAGVFTFNGLTPGSYRVFAQALGYESQGKSVSVAAGEVTEVRFTFTSIAVQSPYHEVIPKKGFWTVAIDTIVAVPNTGVANDEHRFQFDVANEWNTTIIELAFKFSNAAAATTPGAWFNSVATPKGGSGQGMGEVFGKTSPVRAELHPGQPYHDENGRPIGASYPEGAYHHSSYAFPVGLLSDETTAVTGTFGRSRGVGAAINQPFQVYISVFYFEGAPAGWTGLPDE